MVEVARLGIPVVTPRQIAAAELGGELRHLRAIAVIEQPGLVRVIHVPRRLQGAANDRFGLVDGGYEDIDAHARRNGG